MPLQQPAGISEGLEPDVGIRKYFSIIYKFVYLLRSLRG